MGMRVLQENVYFSPCITFLFLLICKIFNVILLKGCKLQDFTMVCTVGVMSEII